MGTPTLRAQEEEEEPAKQTVKEPLVRGEKPGKCGILEEVTEGQ